VTVDACGIARVEELRFLIAAGINRYFPVARGIQDSVRVDVSDPAVTIVTCSPLKTLIRARLRLQSLAGTGGRRDSAVGTVKLSAEMSASVSFAVADARSASRASPEPPTAPTAIRDASLCFHDIRVGGVDVTPRSSRLEAATLGAWLTETFAARGCYDVTSLVYVYLQRGGTLRRSP